MFDIGFRDVALLLIFIFQAGGFFYVTRNHLNHQAQTLDKINRGVAELGSKISLLAERVAALEGRFKWVSR